MIGQERFTGSPMTSWPVQFPLNSLHLHSHSLRSCTTPVVVSSLHLNSKKQAPGGYVAQDKLVYDVNRAPYQTCCYGHFCLPCALLPPDVTSY